MHWIDIAIFALYMLCMLGVGLFFLKKNKSTEDYYVGGRSLGKWHIGLSVVATDVGGGFSIGLGGLGFLIGIAGSWMLLTGLIGAWLASVFLIPKVYALSKKQKFTTFPQLFNHFYGKNVAIIAGLISAIGYLGFTSSQILAGAKLASGSIDGLSVNTALLVMGIIAVIYTSMGGIKAVIYTDTIQWIILLVGLLFIGLPLSYYSIGGIDAIRQSISADMLDFTNVSWQEIVKWSVTIIPIWFVGMTLYQRIYASKSEKAAKQAWYIAGIFEYPVMAFLGVILGLFAKVAYEQGAFEFLGYAAGTAIDAEKGLPILLRTILPPGLMGLMLAAYFSAILSTADSCLIASSGNVLTDILGRWFKIKNEMIASQIITLGLGIIAILIAVSMENVLDLMLYSYAFMVSGLTVPILGAIFFRIRNQYAALASMLSGGLTTITLTILNKSDLIKMPFELDPNIFGISVSLIFFIFINTITSKSKS